MCPNSGTPMGNRGCVGRSVDGHHWAVEDFQRPQEVEGGLQCRAHRCACEDADKCPARCQGALLSLGCRLPVGASSWPAGGLWWLPLTRADFGVVFAPLPTPPSPSPLGLCGLVSRRWWRTRRRLLPRRPPLPRAACPSKIPCFLALPTVLQVQVLQVQALELRASECVCAL